MSLLTVVNVGKHFGAEQILDGISFRLERGDHAGLIGTNGAGKSTLMRIIVGLEEPDVGSVARARGTRIGYLPQDPDFDGQGTLYDAMLEVFRDTIEANDQLRVLERRMAAGEHDPATVEEYGRLQALVEHTGYDFRAQIERVLLGLELDRDLWHTPIGQLSGGQRTRANLARTLLLDADILLLDEPTNHLDITAVEWLEGYLRELKSSFLIVAHDRYLLDRVTNRTLELSFGRLTSYDVPYSRYLELKAERVERQRLEWEAQQLHIAKTEEFVRRYGAGQRSKEARGRQKRLDRLERLERPEEEGTVRLRIGRPKRSGDLVLEVKRLVAGYPNKPLVRLPDEVVVRRGESVAIVGPNGSGKSTLIRTLVDGLTPLAGDFRWGANTTIGYYSQTLGKLDERRSVLEEVQATRPMREEEGRSYLGRFLFSGDDAFKSVSTLSGGERSRVALAKLILEDANVLVLDEPTNHLDILSRDALQEVLEEYSGTLLFVSHDRYLIDSLAHQLWVIESGNLVRYDGTYSAYAGGAARPLDQPGDARPQRGDRSRSPDERLRQLEDEAEALAERLSEVGSSSSLTHLADLMDRYSEVQRALREAQAEWLEAVRRHVSLA